VARAAKGSYRLPELVFNGSWRESEHEKAFQALMEASDAIDPHGDNLEGAIWRMPVADSYAHYLVVKNYPLTLQHIDYSDAWSVPTYVLRGLTRADVVDHLLAQRAWQRLRSAS